MKNRNLLVKMIFPVLTVIFIFVTVSGLGGCKNIAKELYDTRGDTQNYEQEQGKSSGVISLFDSLGVGEVFGYPDAVYDNELNEQLGEFRNQLEIPDDYINVLFMVYVTKDMPSDVIDYYNAELNELKWIKSIDKTSGDGGFLLWKKTSNINTEISYIVVTGKVQYKTRNETVILTGVIIPGYGSQEDEYTEDTAEGSEIGAG